MLPAIHIKRTIDFNKGFRSLLEVLKLVAVSEYHNLERKLRTFERLRSVLGEFFRCIDTTKINHPFLNPGNRPTAVLAVTSDAGLLGGINMQVMVKAMNLVLEMNGRLIVIGDRGAGYAQGAGMSFTQFPGIIDNQRYGQACEIRDFLTQKVMGGELGGIKVVYPRAHSFVIHRVEVETFIPFALPEGTEAAKKAKETSEVSKDIIFESSPREVIEYLAYIIFGQRLFEIFGFSRVCEQAARYLHLEESCNKIAEMNKKLHLQYFRRRHEIIDSNMRELFAARSLYAK